jgi:tRNA (guanine37-N1)-methyltransferase
MMESVLSQSIIGRARESHAVETNLINPRNFSGNKHRKVDDRPYGGGAGMILMANPVHQAIKSATTKKSRVILLSPQGRRFDQATAMRLSRESHLILVCGHYEGLDERLKNDFDEEISIGDYILTGGELPALVLSDALIRLIPGVLKKPEATALESFSGRWLDFPQYTRPQVWRGKKVPAVLLSGDHERINEWRNIEAKKITRRKRPDLIARQA